jgi:hypothetical protein
MIPSLPFEAKASAKTPKHQDTAGTCRERATADLLKSVAMITANERRTLEHSASIWEARALLLERVEETERARGNAAPRTLSA